MDLFAYKEEIIIWGSNDLEITIASVSIDRK